MPITSVQADSKFIHIGGCFSPNISRESHRSTHGWEIFFKERRRSEFRLRGAGSCSLLASLWTGASHLLPLSPTHAPSPSLPPSFAFLPRLNTRPRITIMSSSLGFRDRWIANSPPLHSPSRFFLISAAAFFRDNSACNSSGWQKRRGGEGEIDTDERALKGSCCCSSSSLENPSNRCHHFYHHYHQMDNRYY